MSASPVEYPRNPDTPVSHLPFSPCAVVGNLVFVSGQASVDAQGKIVSDSFEGEFRRSVENLRAVLQTAGCDLKDVVQTRNYVRDDGDLAEYNTLYAEYFPEPRPTRTTITNCLPSTIRYEIECIAVRPN
ncbi:MAG: RidA family protein [Planctomycetaceae bacterium]|nr:RidA family protein [Planctomycetaceae bacterium]